MLDRISMSLKRRFGKPAGSKTRTSRSGKSRLITQSEGEDSSAAAQLQAELEAAASVKADYNGQNHELNSPIGSYETIPEEADADPDESAAVGERLASTDATGEPSIVENGPNETTSMGTKAEGVEPTAGPTEVLDASEAVIHGQQDFSAGDEAADSGPADENAIREKYHVNFDEEGDGEEDYTNGPPRMILTSDGVKDCVALLMTLPLSNKVKSAIEAHREYSNIKKKTLDENDIHTRFGYALEVEISKRTQRLSTDEVMDEAVKHGLEKQLSNLEMMLDINRSELMRIQGDVDYAARNLREQQSELSEELEAAWIYAHLLQPEAESTEGPLKELDVQKEYQKFIEQSSRSDAGTPVAAILLETTQSYGAPPSETLSPEERQQADLRDAAWTAFSRYNNAYQAFEKREEDRQADQRANYLASTRGESHENQEEFDLRWVEKIRELTRELIEAESALSAAKAVAVEAGVEVGIGEEVSRFSDDPEDGYRMSQEQAMIDGAQGKPHIDEWMSGIPEEVASPSFNEEDEEYDEWEARDVEISDSMSMLANDAGDRKRIDKWQKACGLE